MKMLCSIWLLVILVQSCIGSFINTYDGHLDFRCANKNQFVNHIASIHSNKYEDRVFQMGCKDVATVETEANIECYTQNDVNIWDHPMNFQCRDDYYINGLRSDHSNHYEDRQWDVTCCQIPSYHMYGCHYTGWTNNYDQPQDYTVENKLVMKGMISEHANNYEDRRYQYEVCHVLHGGDVIG